MSVADRIAELVPRLKHTPDWAPTRARWRGLMRTMQRADDKLAGKPAPRRKKSGNPGGDTPNSQN